MAQVDQGYQYSVEVKSRFSLFLDDPTSNEDPDILQSRILNQRAERRKKDKPIVNTEELKIVAPENEVKTDESNIKGKAPTGVKPQRLPHTSGAPPCDSDTISPSKATEEHHEVHMPRGRGGPRGFGRGARGRGQGLKAMEGHPSMEPNSREPNFEPRGRGRGRGFSRGRGANYTDYREFERSVGSERSGPRTANSRADHSLPEAAADVDEPHVTAHDSDEPEQQNAQNENVSEIVNGEDETVEEQPKNYTLEEYKAIRSNLKPSVSLACKGTRKANDGKDVFANMVAHKKFNEASEDEVEIIEKEPEVELPFEINVSFTDRYSERGRGSFGGRGNFERGRGAAGFRGGNTGRPRSRGTRGGFRGTGRGRGFIRGGLDQHAAPPIYSDQDFPSLK